MSDGNILHRVSYLTRFRISIRNYFRLKNEMLRKTCVSKKEIVKRTVIYTYRNVGDAIFHVIIQRSFNC